MSQRQGLTILDVVALFPDETTATKSIGAFIHRLVACGYPGSGRTQALFLRPRTLRPRKRMCICQLIVVALLLDTTTEAAGRNGTFVQQLVRERPSLLLAYVGAEHEGTREPAIAFLKAVSGEDFGADLDAWSVSYSTHLAGKRYPFTRPHRPQAHACAIRTDMNSSCRST